MSLAQDPYFGALFGPQKEPKYVKIRFRINFEKYSILESHETCLFRQMKIFQRWVDYGRTGLQD